MDADPCLYYDNLHLSAFIDELDQTFVTVLELISGIGLVHNHLPGNCFEETTLDETRGRRYTLGRTRR